MTEHGYEDGNENVADDNHGIGHDHDEHMDDNNHSLDQEAEFNGGQQSNLGSAGEAIAARHLEGKKKRAAQLAQKYKKDGPTALSKAWFKSLSPLTHVKKNWETIAMTTVAGGALATGGTFLLSDVPNFIAVAKTAALSYPAWNILEGGFSRLGFYSGHAMNAVNRDRFREVKTEPAGMWAGRILAVSLAVGGGVLGNSYMEAVKDVTVNLPTTVTQSIPSGLVDTFTNQSNTILDPVWELPDQATCLYWENINPDHQCLDGQGADGVNININQAIIDDVGQDADVTHMGRALEKSGINLSKPDFIPDMPTNDNMNDWILDQFGFSNESPKMQMQ